MSANFRAAITLIPYAIANFGRCFFDSFSSLQMVCESIHYRHPHTRTHMALVAENAEPTPWYDRTEIEPFLDLPVFGDRQKAKKLLRSISLLLFQELVLPFLSTAKSETNLHINVWHVTRKRGETACVYQQAAGRLLSTNLSSDTLVILPSEQITKMFNRYLFKAIEACGLKDKIIKHNVASLWLAVPGCDKPIKFQFLSAWAKESELRGLSPAKIVFELFEVIPETQ